MDGFFKMYLSIPFENQPPSPPSPSGLWPHFALIFGLKLKKKKREMSHFFFHSSLR